MKWNPHTGKQHKKETAIEMIKNTTFRHRQRRDAKIYVVRPTLGLRPPNLSHPVTLISLKVTMSRPVTLISFKVTTSRTVTLISLQDTISNKHSFHELYL